MTRIVHSIDVKIHTITSGHESNNTVDITYGDINTIAWYLN